MTKQLIGTVKSIKNGNGSNGDGDGSNVDGDVECSNVDGYVECSNVDGDVFLFFSIPAMTSDFEGFSIPNFIHYIYFPIFILEKESVFPFLMFNHKQGSNVDGGVDGSNVGGDVDCSNVDDGVDGSNVDDGVDGSYVDGGVDDSYVDGDVDGSNVDGGVDGLSNVPFTGNIQSNTSTYPISRTMFLIVHEKDPRVYRRQPARPPTTCVLYDFKKTTLQHKSYFASRSTYCYIMICKKYV